MAVLNSSVQDVIVNQGSDEHQQEALLDAIMDGPVFTVRKGLPVADV